MIDTNVVGRFSKGSTTDFGIIYNHYFKAIKNNISKFILNTGVADDILQEVFLKLWENRIRFGAFFGALTGETLRFTRILLADNLLKIGLNNRASVRIVTDAGEAQKTKSNEVEFKIPVDAKGIPALSYVRIEATDENSEQIFSQPIRFLK